MSKLVDYTGKRIGYLTVVKRLDDIRSKDHTFMSTNWLCRCDCGKFVEKKRNDLALPHKNPLSCGCIKKHSKAKHGYSHTKIHQKWLSMKYRCYCERDISYKNYGGRGIKVCDEWLGKDGAKNFIEWALANGWDASESKNLTIDRIDVNGDYCPENCRLVGNEVQQNNKTTNIFVTYNGETMTLKQLCDKYRKKYGTVYGRYKRGLPIEKCLFAKPWNREDERRRNNTEIRKIIEEKQLRYVDIANLLGVAPTTISKWFKNEMSDEKKNMILKIIDEYES